MSSISLSASMNGSLHHMISGRRSSVGLLQWQDSKICYVIKEQLIAVLHSFKRLYYYH